MADFWKVLREKAIQTHGKLPPELYDRRLMWVKDFEAGIDAHQEALKEMMVGEPMRGFLRHHQEYKDVGSKYWKDIIDSTEIVVAGMERRTMPGHHGTDGEEVVVLVVRKEDGKG